MWSDPNVTRLITGRPSSEQQTWARLLSYVGHWVLMGFGYWVAEEKSSSEFVGEVGFADFKRDIASEMKGVPELGFAVSARFHGKGYATEAVRGVLSWADAHLDYERSVCLIDPQNAASLHVAEKCGYRVFAQGVHGEHQSLFLSRPCESVR